MSTIETTPRRFSHPHWTKWKVLGLVLFACVVWVGVLFWSNHQRQLRESAVTTLVRDLGGVVVTSVPSWLPHPWFDRQPPALRAIGHINLFGTAVDDAALIPLGQLSRLQSLDLRNTQITDAGLDSLAGLSELKMLYLEGTQVTEQGVEDLRKELPDCQVIFPVKQ